MVRNATFLDKMATEADVCTHGSLEIELITNLALA
jgi:hypothetical protein